MCHIEKEYTIQSVPAKLLAVCELQEENGWKHAPGILVQRVVSMRGEGF